MTTFALVLACLALALALFSLIALIKVRRAAGLGRVHRPSYADRIPLRVRRAKPDDDHEWSIVLGDLELGRHLAGNGFKVEFEPPTDNVPSMDPTITLILAPDAHELDIEAAVLTALDANHKRQARKQALEHSPIASA